MEPTIKNGSYIICLNTVGHLRDAFQNECIVLGRALTSIFVPNGLKVELNIWRLTN